jgi:hypothetical protein
VTRPKRGAPSAQRAASERPTVLDGPANPADEPSEPSVPRVQIIEDDVPVVQVIE